MTSYLWNVKIEKKYGFKALVKITLTDGTTNLTITASELARACRNSFKNAGAAIQLSHVMHGAVPCIDFSTTWPRCGLGRGI